MGVANVVAGVDGDNTMTSSTQGHQETRVKIAQIVKDTSSRYNVNLLQLKAS
jgi:hypothetical protein